MTARMAELLNQVDLCCAQYGYAPRGPLIVGLREFRDLRFLDNIASDTIQQALNEGLLFRMGQKNIHGIGYALTAKRQTQLVSWLRRQRDAAKAA